MDDTEFCDDWRQARIFSEFNSPEWYPALIADVVAPLAAEFAMRPWFFSMYVCPFGTDDGDTNIGSLPASFITQVGSQSCHASVRLRFRSDRPFEARLTALLAGIPSLWCNESGYPYRPYDLLVDLGGARFGTIHHGPRQSRRARLIAEALRANNLVVLDAILPGPPRHFERNVHPQNFPTWSPFLSLGHMFNNVWKEEHGGDLGVCVTTQNQHGQHVVVREL